MPGLKNLSLFLTMSRETREWWPLLTVEAEVNGDSKSTNEMGPSLVGSLGLIFFSSPYTISFIRPHHQARLAGSRAGSPVSQYVSLAMSNAERKLCPAVQLSVSLNMYIPNNFIICNIVAGDGVLSVFKIKYAAVFILFSSLQLRVTKFVGQEERNRLLLITKGCSTKQITKYTLNKTL